MRRKRSFRRKGEGEGKEQGGGEGREGEGTEEGGGGEGERGGEEASVERHILHSTLKLV